RWPRARAHRRHRPCRRRGMVPVCRLRNSRRKKGRDGLTIPARVLGRGTPRTGVVAVERSLRSLASGGCLRPVRRGSTNRTQRLLTERRLVPGTSKKFPRRATFVPKLALHSRNETESATQWCAA